MPGRTVVELDLEQPLVEYVPRDPLAELAARAARRCCATCSTASSGAPHDDRVVGAGGARRRRRLGLAQIQELRDAVAAFRAAGKRAVAFAETFGEFGPGNGAYYLATAFDEI